MSHKQEWHEWLQSLRKEFEFGSPCMYRDANGRLHREGGPAFVTPTRCQWWKEGVLHGPTVDIYGSLCYYFRGVRVPKHYFTKPETLTMKEILEHPNMEVRRVGLQIYGLDRIDTEGKFVVIDTDQNKQQLLHIDINAGGDLNPSAFVKVFNSTLDSDGTAKTYFLAVPPDIETVKEAIAWTFRLPKQEYNPQQET